MDQSILFSGRDTLLIVIPLLLMTLISAFRLDQIIFKPKMSFEPRRPANNVDEFGEPVLTDPDGRRSVTHRRRGTRS